MRKHFKLTEWKCRVSPRIVTIRRHRPDITGEEIVFGSAREIVDMLLVFWEDRLKYSGGRLELFTPEHKMILLAATCVVEWTLGMRFFPLHIPHILLAILSRGMLEIGNSAVRRVARSVIGSYRSRIDDKKKDQIRLQSIYLSMARSNIRSKFFLNNWYRIQSINWIINRIIEILWMYFSIWDITGKIFEVMVNWKKEVIKEY